VQKRTFRLNPEEGIDAISVRVRVKTVPHDYFAIVEQHVIGERLAYDELREVVMVNRLCAFQGLAKRFGCPSTVLLALRHSQALTLPELNHGLELQGDPSSRHG
jgi:hypothetical protein